MNNKFFAYIGNTGVVANNNTSTLTFNFASDSDFLLQEIRTLGTAMTIQIQEQSGDLFQSNAFTSSVIGGANGFGGLKFIKNNPTIPRNSKILVTFSNASGGSLTDEIQFWGYKQS